MTSPPGTLLGSVLVLLRRTVPERGEGEAHVGPHPGLSLGEEHQYHVLYARGNGRCGGHPYGSVARDGEYGQDEEEWTGEQADRNIDPWWPVNWSTRPQEPDQTATSLAALRIKSTNQAVLLE
jgi:hypothetical protein